MNQIKVHLHSDAVLTNTIDAKFKETSNTNTLCLDSKKSINKPVVLNLDAGTKIRFNNNTYIIVKEFVNSDKLPKLESKKKLTLELPEGTNIIQSNGIPVALGSSLLVELPMDCPLHILEGTRLQQIDHPIQLTTYQNTVGNLVVD